MRTHRQPSSRLHQTPAEGLGGTTDTVLSSYPLSEHDGSLAHSRIGCCQPNSMCQSLDGQLLAWDEWRADAETRDPVCPERLIGKVWHHHRRATLTQADRRRPGAAVVH